MSDQTPTLTVPDAGWYPDRSDPSVQRWWNGQQWTDDVRSVAVAAGPSSHPVSASVFGFGPDQPTVVAPVAPTPVAAWYVDPANPSIRRWWDGSRWTQHTAAIETPAAVAVAPAAPAAVAAPTAAVTTPAYQPQPSYALASGSLAGAPFARSAPNSMATASLVVGLVSILVNPLGAASITAIVLGVVALRRARDFAPSAARRASAVAGIVIAAVAVVIGIVLAVVVIQARNAADASPTAAPYTSGTPKSVEQLKQLITNDVEKYGAVSRVDCPSDASVAPGSTFDCEAVFADGRTTTVDVTFRDDSGYAIGFSPPQ